MLQIIRNLGKIFVNSQEIQSNEEITIGDLTIKVKDLEVHITVNGNVEGDVTTMSGNVSAGDILGDVETMSGNVKASSIKGSVSTMSGKISL